MSCCRCGKLLPPVGKVDTASIVALVLVQLIATGILWSLRQYPGCSRRRSSFWSCWAACSARSCMFYTFALVLYVLLSWVAPGTYSPASALVSSLCEPLLAPVRRVIPPLGGIDFSALFVIIALQALYIAISEYLLSPGY